MNFKSVGLAVVAVAGSYLAFVLASGLGLDPLGLRWDFETVGQLGDSFGPLNTFMAGLAAIGALGAYFAQKQELADAKAEAAKERTLSAKRDFESTLFNLIELFRDTTREIEVPDTYNQNRVSGRDAIKRLVEEKLVRARSKPQGVGQAYRAMYLSYRDDLGHYFRILYQIVRFIDDSSVHDKVLYARIVRASLSNSEIVLLALNCLHGEGEKKFKPLVEKYALLHNISEQDADHWELVSGFAPAAFGDRKNMVKRLGNSRLS